MDRSVETKTTERTNGVPFGFEGAPHQNHALAKRDQPADARAIREDIQKAIATQLALLEPVYADLSKLTQDQVRYLAQSGRDMVDTKIKTTIEIPVT